MADENLICTLRDYSKPSHEGYRNTIELLVGNNVVPLRSNTFRQTIDQSAGGKLRDRNAKESWALLEDLSLYDNESWNDPRDFANSVKEIDLPQDVPSTSDHRLIELENQVQRLMEAHLGPTQPTQVNKITTSCEICNGSHDTQYCMEDPEQAFDEYASSPEEEGSVEPSKTGYTNREEADETDEEVESKKEVEEENEGVPEEEREDDPEHFDTFPTMKELRLKPRRKPSNPKKNCNFVGRVKGLKVFVGNFTYEYDFMVLEDTTSVIDHYFGLVMFRKPFVEETGFVYNIKEGTAVFEKHKEKIVFKMPHKIGMFEHIDFADISTDRISLFIIESDNNNCDKTHYSDSLDLGPEYKYDEYVCRGIRSLIAAKSRRKNKGEVT
ncbi:hypothetical protein Tco_1253240 [Tanacetum coccineum]